MRSITIMICTYKRNDKLANSIKSILNLDYDLSKINLVIVDNDINGGAREVINKFKNKVNIYYEVEPKEGISYARNRCLYIANKINNDYVAFIDDDEIVSREWLKELIRVLEEGRGDIVRGPVIGTYNYNLPSWYKKLIINNKIDKEDGAQIDICFTGNVLMKKDIIENNCFDTKYALTGGEDTKFFMKLNKEGKKILYAKYAIVEEDVPKERITLSYILTRAFRDSVNYVIIEREVLNKKKSLRLLKAIIKIVINIIKLPIALCNGYYKLIETLRELLRGIGEFYGVVRFKTVTGYKR